MDEREMDASVEAEEQAEGALEALAEIAEALGFFSEDDNHLDAARAMQAAAIVDRLDVIAVQLERIANALGGR